MNANLAARVAELERRLDEVQSGEQLVMPQGLQVSPSGVTSSIYLVQSETPFIPVGPTVTAEAINAVINQLPANGGTIVLPAGDFTIDTPVNANNTKNVTLLGAGSSYGGTRLKSGGAFDLVTARSSGGFRMQGVALWNFNAGFTGQLLNLASLTSGGVQDTGLFRIDDCNFTAAAGATGYGINLQNSISGTITGCYFINGGTGIRGLFVPGDFCNANQIAGCFFQGQKSIAISNLGDGCGVQGCTFEPLNSGAPGAYFQDNNLPCAALQWQNNWTGDATAGGTWMTIYGQSIAILGSIFSGGTTGIQTNNSCSGVLIMGNTFGFAAGITASFDTTTGTHDNLIYLGNDENSVTTPLPTTNNWGQGSIVRRTGALDSVNDIVAGFGDVTQVRVGNIGGSSPIIYFGTAEQNDIHCSLGTPDEMHVTSDGIGRKLIDGNGGSDFAQTNNTAITATAGTRTLPANPAGFFTTVTSAGVTLKIPYYNV